jgi:amino acid adenylation domain-containing protein
MGVVEKNEGWLLTQDPIADTTSFRLSPQQEQLWRSDPESPRLRVQCVVRCPGAAAGAVHDALRRVVARHEILRTTFVRTQGVTLPAQAIHDELEPEWSEHPGAGGDNELGALLTAEAAVPIDLLRGPTVRAIFAGESLVLTVPAVCADAKTLAVVAAELTTLLSGAEPTPAEPLQYADYAEWRSESLRAAPAETGTPSLDDVPPSPVLPFTRAEDEADAGMLRTRVSLDAAAVRRGASACRVPDAVFLEACWHACVARLAGEDVVVLGAVLDGRTHEDLAAACGPFAQTLPIRTTIDDGTTVAELVDRVRRARGVLEQTQDSADGSALAEIAARCRVGFSAVTTAPESGIEALVGAPTRFLAQLAWIVSGENAHAEIVTAAALDADAARLAAAALAAVVDAAADDTSTPVHGLPLAAGAERLSILIAPESAAVVDSVPQLFEQRVAATPEHVALVASGSSVTYEELNVRANRLAHRLRALGVRRDTSVGLCFERSVDSIVAVLGTLKAGGAYVPLNYEHPEARLTHQLTETAARVLLAESSLRDRLPEFAGTTIFVDDETSALSEEPADNPDPVNEADDLVYVMYTSGSTGTPKGVGVTHANLVNYTNAVLERLGGTDEALAFAAVSALSTDLGNTSIFPSLLAGGTLHLVSPDDSIDGARFAAYLETHPVDVLKITPSHLRALLGGAAVDTVMPRRWLVFGGEALAWQFVDRLQRAGAACRILNHYGPTETTIGTSTFEVGVAERWGETVPIGAPLRGTHAYVVDRSLRPLPIGVAGELCIGGAGVARGYLRQPELTAASFVPDPGVDRADARMYRTGDRARVLRDGNVEFLGRVDDQVKIRGYRVEPAEIEAALARHPDVRECAVVARDGADGERALVGYIVGGDATADELQAFLRELLPAYMVPQRFVKLEALPFTPSGKIDRRALPEPGEADRRTEYVAPRTPLEEGLAQIWQDLLGVERVGVHDDFFALGGHSLLATQAVIRIRSAFVEIPLHSLFNAPTVAGLAEAIVQTELEAEGASVPSGGAAA